MAHVSGLRGERAGKARPLLNAAVLRDQVAWFTTVAAIAFLVPLLFASVLDFHHDVYYLVYFTITLALLGIYIRANHVNVREAFSRNWKLSLALGMLSAAFVVWSVLARIDSTPHPSGPYFAFEILWRGALYGLVDALLLSAFPSLVAWQLMHRNIAGFSRRLLYAAVTLVLVIIITATYHAGYEDLRNTRGLSQPEIGNTIISIPVIVSSNPVGSLIAHTSMHLAAVTHSYESRDRLPPQVFVVE
jgi:hypothetical protein